MKHYINSRLGEYIALLALCVGVGYSIYEGFILEDVFSNTPPIAIFVTAVILAVIYMIGYKRMTAIIGTACASGLIIIAIVFIQYEEILDDEESNSTLIFFLITFIVCFLLYLLSRSRAGCIIALIAGNIIFAGSWFLDYPVKIWMYILLIGGGVLLFFMRIYTMSAIKSIVGRVRFLKYFIQSILFAAAAMVVSGVLFVTVIEPLNPPVKDLELISILRSMDIMEVFGTASEREVYNEDLASGRILDGSEYADDEGDDENDDVDENETEDQDTVREWLQNSGIYRTLEGINYQLKKHKYAFLITIPIVVIFLIFFIRYMKIVTWRKKVRKLPKEEGVLNYYNYFLKRLKKIGMGRPATMTIDQYAKTESHALEPFADGESNIDNLTRIYGRVYYGHLSVDDEEYKLFESFYDRFYGNLRKELGLPKYMLKMLTL